MSPWGFTDHMVRYPRVWFHERSVVGRDGTRTRQRILDAAEALVLDRGFAGTTVDDILDAAEATKGAFFHHFETKDALAAALMDRYAALDLENLDRTMARAEQLSTDPLQQLLLFVGLYRELFLDLEAPYPGCLMASYTYEAGLFDESVRATIADNVRTWHDRLRAKLDEVARTHPQRVAVDLDSLADAMVVVVEGAFVVSRMRDDPGTTAAQLDHLRTYLELLFGGAGR